jgi:hypothetical protein
MEITGKDNNMSFYDNWDRQTEEACGEKVTHFGGSKKGVTPKFDRIKELEEENSNLRKEIKNLKKKVK